MFYIVAWFLDIFKRTAVTVALKGPTIGVRLKLGNLLSSKPIWVKQKEGNQKKERNHHITQMYLYLVNYN